MTTSYRLSVVRNVVVAGSSTYGSGDYGDGVYGERATDSADQQSYVAVAPSGSSVFHVRVGDTETTIELLIVSFGGPFEDGEGDVLDLSSVDTAVLHIERVSRGVPVVAELAMTVASDTLTRKLAADDFAPGRYDAHVVLTFVSGRRLTVPLLNPTTITAGEGAD